MRKLLTYMAGVCLIALAGCGGPTPPEELELVSTTQSLDTCTLSSLDWSNSQQACNGPVYYGTQCHEGRVDRLCDNSSYVQKTCYNACEIPQNVTVYREIWIAPSVTYVRVCDEPYCEDNHCDKPVCFNEPRYSYAGPCYTAAYNLRNQLVPDVNQQANVGVSYTYPPPPSDEISALCKVTLTNVPEKKSYGPGDPICGAGYAYQCDDTDKPIYSYCRDTSFGVAAPSFCGASLRSTPFGATVQGAREQAKKEWTDLGYRAAANVVFTTEPTCSTCEQQTTVPGKFDCLKKSFDLSALYTSGTEKAQLQQELVRRLKLLFELEGEQLSDTQRETARGLYAAYPSYEMACATGVDFTALSTDSSSCAGITTLNANLDLCFRLTGSYVPIESAEKSHGFCAGLATAVANVPLNATCKGADYRTTYFSIMYKLTQRQATTIRLDSSDPTKLSASDIRRALRFVDDWYAAGHSNFINDADFRTHLTRLLADVWKAAYDRKVNYVQTLTSTSTEQEINTYLEGVSKKSWEVEREVLTVLFTADSSGYPMRHEPMLLVLGDGLKGLNQRLTELVPLHDFACRFKHCSSVSDRSEMSHQWAMLGFLHNKDLLTSAISNNAPASTVTVSAEATAWRAVFTQIASNHTALQVAMQDAISRMPTPGDASKWESMLLSGESEKIPASAALLSQLIQDSRARTDSFKATGLLTPGFRNTLYTGIIATERTNILNRLKQNRDTLNSQLLNYRGQRASLISALQNELSGTIAKTRLTNQILDRAVQVEDLSLDLAGLRYNLEAQQARFADFSKAFNELMESEKLEGAQLQYARNPDSLLINALDSDFSASDVVGGQIVNYNGIEQMAVKKNGVVWKRTLHPGDLLNMQTTGVWSPNCSLSQVHTLNTSGLPATKKPYITTAVVVTNSAGEPITTGPEGYSVQAVGSDYQASGTSRVQQNGTYWDNNDSFQECEGLRASVGFSTPPTSPISIGVEAYRSVQACESSSSGEQGSRTNSTNSSTGKETRISATFNRGLRLPNTPFPNMPVGSLLLVEMPAGVTALNQVKNIQVVQSGSGFFTPTVNISDLPNAPPPGDSDVYLVVNDNQCNSVSGAQALSFSFTRVQPLAGTQAGQLKTAMLKTIDKLRDRESEVVGQGRMLPGDRLLLRSEAIANLGTDLSIYPAELRQLYEAWLDKELAQLEKKVELVTVERAMRRLTLEMKGLQEELSNAEQASRLYRLATSWNLRDVDASELRDAGDFATIAIGSMMRELYPVLELRYPTTLHRLKTETYYRNQLEALIHTGLEAPLLTKLDNTSAAITAILTAFENTSTDSLIKPGFLVTLRFPRPGMSESSTWRIADEERSKKLWQAVDTGTRTSLSLTPWDLYTNPLQPGQLGCREAAPVIESMGFHFVWYHPLTEQLNGENVRVEVEFDQSQLFTTEQGPVSYIMDNTSWTTQYARVTFNGAIANADDRFGFFTVPQRVGEGLSPFTKFSIDFEGVKTALATYDLDLSEATEVLVMFNLAPRSATSNIQWSGVCN